ncbi:unnamed protein product [Adineta ricciae]|uniref:Acyl carrier protein n=1 Tax=Adineta ricciae TaxID=249248 RepID=A0A815VMY6_ADIRI|nr:unnamed protein product [Adineta ricciae]
MDELFNQKIKDSKEYFELSLHLKTVMSVFDQVKEIVVAKIGASPDTVEADTRLNEDLGLDDLDTVELIFAIEQNFQIEITDEETQKFRTVGDIVDCVVAKAKK